LISPSLLPLFGLHTLIGKTRSYLALTVAFVFGFAPVLAALTAGLVLATLLTTALAAGLVLAALLATALAAGFVLATLLIVLFP
jgi:hypothetical protein